MARWPGSILVWSFAPIRDGDGDNQLCVANRNRMVKEAKGKDEVLAVGPLCPQINFSQGSGRQSKTKWIRDGASFLTELEQTYGQ